MLVLTIGIAITILGAIISCIDKWKSPLEEKYKKNNRIALALLISVFLAQSLTFYTGRSAIQDKILSDRLAMEKDRDNKIASDSIKALNRQLQELVLQNLDTTKSILKYSQELNTAYQTIAKLQGKLNSYFIGDDIIPWITAIPGWDRITFTMLNLGQNPMWNVKIKCQEQQLPDIGVLPTRVNHRYYTAMIPKDTKTALFDFVIWYNNGKSVLVDVYVSRKPDGFLNQDSVVYLDRNGIRFEHPLIKHRPKGYWNYKTPGYKPDQTF